MDYKQLYVELCILLNGLNCCVCDYDFLGFANYANNIKGFVYISPSLSYKDKYLTLAHEAGHLFYMKKGALFSWSKTARTEDQANWFAMQLIRMQGVDVNEYKDFYNKIKNRKKVRRKSWFEL